MLRIFIFIINVLLSTKTFASRNFVWIENKKIQYQYQDQNQFNENFTWGRELETHRFDKQTFINCGSFGTVRIIISRYFLISYRAVCVFCGMQEFLCFPSINRFMCKNRQFYQVEPHTAPIMLNLAAIFR